MSTVIHKHIQLDGGGNLAEKFYYLCGPMSGYENHNFPEFHQKASALRDSGFNIVNPAELDEEQIRRTLSAEAEHELLWAACLRRDLRLVEHENCAGAVLLDGWEQSKGARLETYVAEALGLELLRFVEGRGAFGWFDLSSVDRAQELKKAGIVE